MNNLTIFEIFDILWDVEPERIEIVNGSSWTFPLAATVPSDMMARCHRALPRPPFENLMYYSCVTALVFCLVCVLACAYLEGDRAIACAIREHYSTTRTVFDLNNLDSTGKSLSPPKKEKPTENKAPADLHAAEDASTFARAFYHVANLSVKAVHVVWRWSLRFRKTEEEQAETSSKKKKKKERVGVVKSKTSNSIAKEKTPPMTPQTQLTTNNKEKNKLEVTKPKLQQMPSLKKSPGASTNSKPSQKPDASPKTATNFRHRKEAPKKKMSGEINRIEKTERLMDNFDEAEKKARRGSKDTSRRSLERKSAQIAQPELTTPITVSIPPSTPAFPSIPTTISYSEYDDPNRPVTPTPSLASSFNYDGRPTRNISPARSDLSLVANSLRQRHPSDGAQSCLSELSGAPDWADASISHSDDIDEDFAALSAATAEMSGHEWSTASSSSHTSMRHDGRLEYDSPMTPRSNERNAFHTTGFMRNDSISDWPIPDMAQFNQIYDNDINLQNSGLWNTPSLAPGTSWMTSQPGLTQPSSSPWTGAAGTYDPLTSGLSLGASLVHGTVFSGEAFSVWSEQATTGADISSAWSHLVEPKTSESGDDETNMNKDDE